MIKYKYNNKEYYSVYQLRQQIWKTDHIAFGSPSTKEQWAKFGVQMIEYEPVVTDEQLAARVRMKRDTLLKESDFFVMSDYQSDQESLKAVKEYRQTLRDITKQQGFPKDVTFPQKPIVLYKQPQKSRMLSAMSLAKVGI